MRGGDVIPDLYRGCQALYLRRKSAVKNRNLTLQCICISACCFSTYLSKSKSHPTLYLYQCLLFFNVFVYPVIFLV